MSAKHSNTTLDLSHSCSWRGYPAALGNFFCSAYPSGLGRLRRMGAWAIPSLIFLFLLLLLLLSRPRGLDDIRELYSILLVFIFVFARAMSGSSALVRRR
jgi:hypothetical protein